MKKLGLALTFLLACALAVGVVGCGGSLVTTTTSTTTTERIEPTKALFIGNSILVGNGGSGMCASDPDHDYYALVNEMMDEVVPKYSAERVSGIAWENATSSVQRGSLMREWNSALTDDLDYVIVQLGDNANLTDELETFSADIGRVIEYVRGRCPEAAIIWVAAWYSTEERQQAYAEVCAEYGVLWVDIMPLNTSPHRASLDDEVVFLDGTTHIVDEYEVATHPGDEGMRLIAQAVFAAMRP